MELSSRYFMGWVTPLKLPIPWKPDFFKFLNHGPVLNSHQFNTDFFTHFRPFPDLYLFLSPDFKILDATDAYLTATLSKREKIIGHDLFEIFPDNPDAGTANATKNLKSSLKTVLKTKRPHAMSVQHYDVPDPDGGFCEKYWLPVNTPVLDTSGKILYIVHKVTDVTEEVLLKKENKKNKLYAEKSREEHSEILRVLETIPQMAWTHLPNGRINYVNEKWLNYSGYDLEKTEKGGWTSLLHPDEHKKTIESLNQTIKSGKNFQSETRLKRKDGKYHWHLILEKAIRDETGKIILWVGTATDIQQQKLINERKDEFIGIAGHELRSPLTSLKAYIQLLERYIDKGTDEVCKNFIHKTNTYITRLNYLVTDLLDVSKIQSGKLSFDIVEFKLDDLLYECLESLRLTGLKHQIEVIGDACICVKGDRFRLEQVFSNFLSNAIKYSPDADRIVITIGTTKNEVKIEVTDFGIGIPHKKIARLFQRFSRVENEKQKFQGLGLGLYISAEIIKRHGGRVGVKSEPGKGSTFYFTIPHQA